jgi:hypothetical protein
MNLDRPLSCGVNPRIPLTATGENELVHVAIYDCKPQVTVSWNVLNGCADIVPHSSLVELSGNFRLDLAQWR